MPDHERTPDRAHPPARGARGGALPPSAVGGRVVVRHRLPDGAATDAVGALERTGAVLAVRRDDGSLVEVVADDVVASRRVPPRVRRPRPGEPVAGVLDLEAALARAWQPPQVARSGRWLLRSSADRTRRASSVLVLGAPEGDLGAAVDAAGGWMRHRGATPRFQLPRSTGAPVGGAARADAAGLQVAADVDALLAQRGWPLVSPTTVLVGGPQVLRRRTPSAADLAPVDLAEVPGADWHAVVRPGEGGDPVLGGLLLSAPEQVFATAGVPGDRARADGAVAAGRMALVEGWAVLTDLAVLPRARRGGLARAVVAALSTWAAERGAGRLALQVADGNDAARALYGSLGLVEHHRYAYREHP